MDTRGLAGILAALVLVSLVSGVSDPPVTAGLRILLADKSNSEQGPVSKSPPPPTGANPSPSSPSNSAPQALGKSPPLSKPSIPQPAPDAPLKSASPPKSIPNPPPPSVPSPPPPDKRSQGASPSQSPSKSASDSPPKKKNEKGSAITGSPSPSEEKPSGNYECPSSSIVECSIKGFSVCLKNESEGWVIVVKNEGETPLNVIIVAPPSVETQILVPKHSASKVQIAKGTKSDGSVMLKALDKTCNFTLGPRPSRLNLIGFQHHGFYVLSFSLFVGVGVWLWCKFRKKRRGIGGGGAYQQLEMSSEQPPAVLTNDARVDGWDEHWSEDWDEEEARPRAPEGRTTAPTKSSSDRNDWEDWDD